MSARRRSWAYLGDESDPRWARDGSVVPVTVLDEPLIVVRDGRLRLLSNVCTHRGMVLADRPCRGPEIVCRYHGRAFGLDGQVLRVGDSNPALDAHDRLAELPIGRIGTAMFASPLGTAAQWDAIVADIHDRMGDHLERAIADGSIRRFVLPG